MFNPFRKNAKVVDLTPTLWEKIRLRAFMAWAGARVLFAHYTTQFRWEPVVAPIMIVVGISLLAWAFKKDTMHKHQMETAPCSAFANETMEHVPLRCLQH